MHTYTTVDKSGWARGEWDNEPDKIVWVDSATDLDCMVRRGPGGAWCGYVAVPPPHPWHGKGYSQCLVAVCKDETCWAEGHSPDSLMNVHGGLTYADVCVGDEQDGICHVPDAGREHNVWWFGFDCHHAYDLGPAHEAVMAEYGLGARSENTYRNLAYVRAEVLSLALQLKEHE